MLDIGWSELLVIGVVALIVVGPKDLPIMFRRMGEFTGKARRMAREFSQAMNAAADEAGVKEMAKDLRNVANPRQMGLDAINKAADDLANWDDAGTPAKPSAPSRPAADAPATDKPEGRTPAAPKTQDHSTRAGAERRPAEAGAAPDDAPAARAAEAAGDDRP